MAKTKDSLSSVSNAMRILQEFSIEERELGISELSKRLGLAKSTVYRLMNTLRDAMLVEKNEETQKYFLGIGAFELGFKVYHSMEVRKIAVPLIENLTKRVRRVVRLGMYDNGGVIYLCKRAPGDDPTISNIGNRVPSHCTAVGKVLLANQKRSEIDRITNQELEVFTNKTIVSSEKLKKELIQVKNIGYAVTYGELRTNVCSVAVPVYDDFGKVIAAISVTGNKSYFYHQSSIQNYVKELKMHSRLLTERLGLEFAL